MKETDGIILSVRKKNVFSVVMESMVDLLFIHIAMHVVIILSQSILVRIHCKVLSLSTLSLIYNIFATSHLEARGENYILYIKLNLNAFQERSLFQN